VRTDFQAAWETVCPFPPVAHELKGWMPDRWIRFHSLPHGKRYAESAEELEVVLQRADELLAVLCNPGSDVLLITGLHEENNGPPDISDEQAMAHTDALYWCSLQEDPLDPHCPPLHLWASWERYHNRAFDTLFSLTADWSLYGVLLVIPESQSVVHPYDGGTDVLLSSTEQRDQLQLRFAEWVSDREDGL
jgi:hypothetical protein